MTALLEFKQKVKNFYGQYEIYLLPLIKFGIALIYFYWLRVNMGYYRELNNLYILLVVALICSILPSAATVLAGYILIIGHTYGLGLEVMGFTAALIALIGILFLRFSGGHSMVAVCTPLSFAFDIPVLLPIGSGLLGSALAAFPAASGVITYYYIRLLRSLSGQLMNPEIVILDKLKLILDGMITNSAMWLTIIAFVAVILLVNLIRTRSFDYAWRIAIVAGGATYILVMIGGSMFIEVSITMESLVVQTVVSVVVGLILEFFFFGGDYSRTERLQYEDDDYYYFVKAVPKATVSRSERSIKRITGQPPREERRAEDSVVTYEKGPGRGREQFPGAAPVDSTGEIDQVDFEKKLEESLRDL